MKLYLSISEPDYFLDEDYDWCFSVHADPDLAERVGEIPCGEIDVEIDVDNNIVKQFAVNAIEEKIGEIRATSTAAINALESDKQKFLSIEHKVAS